MIVHWYKRNIGDYAKKAGKLTMLQHGAYTLLMDACYDRERFPTLDEAMDWCWASTPDEMDAVRFVLARFFTLDADGRFIQDRVLEELIAYQEKADKNKKIAIDRETKRRENGTKRARIVNDSPRIDHESPPNQEPVTNNHKPNKSAVAPPDGVSSDVWQSFVKARKARRAPITDVVIEGIKREADKAGWTMENAIRECVERGWQSFKSEWVAKPADIARVTAPGPKGPDPELQRLVEQRALAAKPPPEIMAKIKEWTGR